MRKITAVGAVWLMVCTVMLAGCFEKSLPSDRSKTSHSFESIAWNRMSVANKVTFIGYDEDSFLDDYSYLASVPASVFYDKASDNIYSHPLLYYNEPYETDDVTKRTYNDHQGLSYFMDDFLTVAGEIDTIEYVNMKESDIAYSQKQWNANDTQIIDEKDPYATAAEIALLNWEYSRNAVLVPIIEDYPFENIATSGSVSGSTPDKQVKRINFQGTKEPSPVQPNDHDFEIEEGYKYVTAYMTWGEDWTPEQVRNLIERGKDPDLQLFDMEIGQVGASEEWNVLSGPQEYLGSYVYNDGDWRASVTYMPTEQMMSLDEDMDSLKEVIDELNSEPVGPPEIDEPIIDGTLSDFPCSAEDSTAKYNIDITVYPGVDIPLPHRTNFSTRNAELILESDDPSQNLGIIVNGPSGAEITADISDSANKVVSIPELGIGQYSVSVVNLNDDASPTGFTVSYKWEQTRDITEGLALSSAAQGAVIGSMYNAPLLYTKMGSVPTVTKKALDTLGVRKVTLVNIDGYASGGLKGSIEDCRSFYQSSLDVTEYKDIRKIYDLIKDRSAQNGTWGNDVVFSTVNPWSTWEGGSHGPKEEIPKAMHIGPGAYAAALHGTPLIVLDIEERLSCSQAWHNHFWRFNGRAAPSVACMVLTGFQVYDYLAEYGFDLKDTQESILTVAGQYDIGVPWDRVFTEAAYPGRIMGTPVDASYWISRSAFYPYMIFANPGVSRELDEHDGKRITGSSSERVAGVLTITEPEREVEVTNPVLETWVSYQHKFNELASEYWGCPYTTRTGITPYFTESPYDIDKGLGGNYPDITTSEIVSYYSKEGNFDEVFTTNFPQSMENLNRGVIMWYEVMHGGSRDGGIVGFWNMDQNEPNPWRGYEENGIPLVSVGDDGIIGSNPLQDLTKLRGSTADPDVVTMSKYYGLDLQPSTGPMTDAGVIPETHDGVIIAILQQGQTGLQDGYMWDDAMDNIHSVGFSAGSCLIANTYLHLTTMRHGSVFQIIDPWLTSWYSSFAMEMFAKDQATGGYTVGESYVRGITHVGIQYLVDGWWWDIFENLVYYGDPDIIMYTPNNAWDKPVALPAGTTINGHSFSGAEGHPYRIGSISTTWIVIFVLLLIGAIAAAIYIIKKRKWGAGKKTEIDKVDKVGKADTQ